MNESSKVDQSLTTVRRIAKNTGVLFAGRVLSFALSFFYVMYTARYLGPVGFGILSFALAFTQIFGIFTDFGLRPVTVREVARDNSLASKYLSNISGMKIILATTTFGLIALVINLLGYPEQTVKVVYLVALSVILTAFTQTLYSIFQAFERMEYQSVGQILNGILMLSGVMFAIQYNFGVIRFASLYLIASIVVWGFNLAILKWKFSKPALALAPWKIEVNWSFWKSTIKEALPFGLAITFVTIFCWVDSVMLSLMKGDVVVGWYNAAFRMVFVLLFIPSSFTAAIYPVMSKFYKTSQDSLRLSYERSFKYLAMIGIPIGVGTTLLAKRFILLIFGIEYTNSIIVLQILAWFSVFVFMSIPFGNLFNCLNRQSIVTKITGICVLFNVILNLILIPKYSLIGAAITTVSTQFISLVLHFIWSLRVRYSIPNKKLAGILTKVLISSTLMGIFIISFDSLTLLVLVPSAALSYFGILYIIRGINKEDIKLFRRTVQRI